MFERFLCKIGLHDLGITTIETETGCDVHCGEWSVRREFKHCMRVECFFRKFVRFVE